MEYLVLVILGIAGILLHIMTKFIDEVTKVPKNGKPFKQRLILVWSHFDLLGMLAYAILALILVLVFAGVRESLVDLYPITPISILLLGYAADSAINNLKSR